MKSFLEKGNNKFILDNYKINNASENIQIDYKFNISDYINVSDNELFLNMNFLQPLYSFELLKDDRVLDYEFDFKSLIKLTYIFDVPESYEISYLPQNCMSDNVDFLYNISYEKIGNKIIYKFSLKLNILLLKQESFVLFNSMLKKMRSNFKEVVVLKKIK